MKIFLRVVLILIGIGAIAGLYVYFIAIPQTLCYYAGDDRSKYPTLDDVERARKECNDQHSLRGLIGL